LWDEKAEADKHDLGNVMPMLAPVVTRVPLTGSALLGEEGVHDKGADEGWHLLEAKINELSYRKAHMTRPLTSWR
jgi:hypothetical protein